MSENSNPPTIFVPVGDIEIPKNFRKPSPEKVAGLADSIRDDGLLQPVGVRKGANKPFALVFGGHRLAAHKKLGKADIEARLLDIDEDAAESATLAENLFRNQLAPAEYFRAMKRWQEIYTAKHPETVGIAAISGKARRREAAKPGRRPSGGGSVDSVSKLVEADQSPSPTPRFDEAAAKAMNVTDRTVRRDAKVARTLSDADLDVLHARGVPMEDIRKLAAIPDDEARQRALALVASGMAVPTAIALGTSPENSTIEHIEAEDSGIKPEADMTDGEWLEHYCRDALARLRHHDTFRRDAIVWRHTRAAVADLRSKTRKQLAQSKTYRPGPWASRLASILNVLHPNDWPKCGPCDGTGQDRNVSQCGSCRGSAYSLMTGARKS